MPPANRTHPKRAKSSQSLYSLHEFVAEFGDDEACLEWLWRERHSDDGEHAHCPKCEKRRGFKRYTKTKQQRQCWTCTGCGHHIHPTAGTIFEKSSRPLSDWFYVMYLVSSSRCGVAAKQVERELGCNYRTAWRTLNKVRNVLMEQDDEQLSGEVEVDETFMGGGLRNKDRRRSAVERGEGKRPYATKPRPVVFAAVERQGRIRATVVDDSKPATLLPLVREYVMPESLIFTDEYWVYDRLNRTGYGHRRIRHKERIYVEGDVHTQTADGFFGHFKTDIRGTHHSISRKWLLGYLNEWVWKWNRRDDDEAMFRQLIRSAAATG